MDSNTPQLKQHFNLFMACVLIVSSIIGAGVFKKVAPMSATLMSPGWVILAWVLAGLVSLAGALSAAEISGLLAKAGGQFVYFRKMYGDTFAFFYGWACFTTILSSSIASIAYVFAQSLYGFLPFPEISGAWTEVSLGGIIYPFRNLSVKLITIAAIWALSILNYRGVKQSGTVSKLVIITVLAGIVFIVLSSFLSAKGSFENIRTNSVQYGERFGSPFLLISAMFTALLGAFWPYEGWNSLGFIGGEIQDAKKNLPRAFFWGMLIVIGTYVIANISYLYAMPIDQIIAISKTENGIAGVEVMRNNLGQGGALFISLLIIVSTFGCTNTTILMASRVYFAMAKEGVFFPKAAEIHPKYHSPANALIMQAIWASCLVLSGSFDQLTDMLIFASFIFYGANAAGLFVLRKTMANVHRPYKVFGYPWVPIFFIVFCGAFLVNTLIERPREALLGLGLIASGLPFYLYWKRKNRPVPEGDQPLTN